MKSFWLTAVVLLAGSSAAPAQTLSCDSQNHFRSCEIREVTVPATGALDADTGGVGGITVRAWDGDSILVRAQITADSPAWTSLVQIGVATGRVWADGPAAGDWTAAFEISVPRQTALTLHTKVGAISIAGVTGIIVAETHVGAITLADVAGDVRAATHVGAIAVTLSGDRWDGKGLDLSTSTGAIEIMAPRGYAASFDLATKVGKITTSFPGARPVSSGFVGRTLVFDSNGGGAPIHGRTSVGAITLVVAP